MENNSYASYQGMMAKVDTALVSMEKLCGDLEMEEARKDLARSREKLENHRFAVGIMGEFKRGKSTVINSLLEQEIMPADILPCSATMNRVTYDLQSHVELRMQDGSMRSIKVDELVDYVTKLNSENESRAANVDEAVVYYPCKFCQNGVDIVDTPGLNDDDRMNKISEEVIPKLDAVIMVITPGSPFSMSEAEFVRNKLMSSDLSRLIFLVNKIDTIRRPDDRIKIVEGIKAKIRETVLEKMKDMYGEDSRQYKEAEQKLGSIRIFPFSALDALEGKLAGDQKMIEDSGTRPFEEMLTKMLTEERGALELGTPISVLQRVSMDVTKTITARRDAFALSVDEFEQRQKAAIARIQELRDQKKEEKKHLRSRAETVKKDLASRTAQFYPQLEQRMMTVVDEFYPADIKALAQPKIQEKAAAELQERIRAEMNGMVSNFSEKIAVELQDIIGQEAVGVAQFAETISKQVDQMRVNLTGSEQKKRNTDLIATGIDVVTDFAGLYGIGGAVAGYQAAGVKGLLVGGGAGLVANLAVAGILSSMAIVGLPMLVVSCAVGTFVGRKVPTIIFAPGIGEKKLREIKAEMKKNITASIRDMQTQRDLENWVESMVGSRFDQLSASMEEDCEKILRDTEKSMDEIRRDLARSETERENAVKKLEKAEASCVEIITDLKPVCEKVSAALKEVA